MWIKLAKINNCIAIETKHDLQNFPNQYFSGKKFFLVIFKMVGQTEEIQQLLAAEKRATEKVAEAKKRKTRRLKDAKDEAQVEIEEFRKEKERQFKEFEDKHLGNREDVAARIEADTQLKIQEMNKAVAVHKQAVIEKILELVYDIKPEVHKNFKVFKPNKK